MNYCATLIVLVVGSFLAGATLGVDYQFTPQHKTDEYHELTFTHREVEVILREHLKAKQAIELPADCELEISAAIGANSYNKCISVRITSKTPLGKLFDKDKKSPTCN